MQRWMDENCIEHVVDKKQFVDGALFYRLKKDYA